jgi:hypothetical protein
MPAHPDKPKAAQVRIPLLVGRHREYLNTHELRNFDAKFKPKLTKDGWGCEELPVLSEEHTEYDIWSHGSISIFKAGEDCTKLSATNGLMPDRLSRK